MACVFTATRFKCGHQIAGRSVVAVTHSTECKAQTFTPPKCPKTRITQRGSVNRPCYYCDLPDDTKMERLLETSTLSWFKDDQLYAKIVREKVEPYLSPGSAGSPEYGRDISIILYNTFEAHREKSRTAFTAVDKIIKASVEEMAQAKATIAATKTGADKTTAAKVLAEKTIAEQAAIDIKAALEAEEAEDDEWEKIEAVGATGEEVVDDDDWVVL